MSSSRRVAGRNQRFGARIGLKAEPIFDQIPFVFMTGWAPHLDTGGHERGLLTPFRMEDLCGILIASIEGARSRLTGPA
jgi:hypothetical protein